MKKKIVLGGSVFVLIAAGAWMGLRHLQGGSTRDKGAANSNRPVSAEDVAADPGRYKGPLEMEGVVTGLAGSGGVFFLGCPDGCLSVPVKYPGKMPEPGGKLIVSGELKSQDGKYVFE